MFVALATLILAAIVAFLILQRSLEPRKKLPPAQESVSLPNKAAQPPTINMDDFGDDDATPRASPTTEKAPPMFVMDQEEPASKPSKPAPRPSSLMPPPALPMSSLRVPGSGPLPNRGPPQKLSAPTLAANTAGQRNKVVLGPGYSPLDWATLSRNSDLSGVPGLQRVTPSMLAFHHGRKGRDAWSSFRGKVYNITPYLPFHPGGKGELMRAAGKDGEKLFMEIHAWVNWENMLSSCVVGIMVAEDAGKGLDELD